MESKPHIYGQSGKQKTPIASTELGQPMFQSRPFVVQSETNNKSTQQPDLITQLKQVARYGHRLSQTQPFGVSVPTTVQPQLREQKGMEPAQAQAAHQPVQTKVVEEAPKDHADQSTTVLEDKLIQRQPRRFDENDDYEENNDKTRGKKGETFRGGSRKRRDNWFGYNDKDFQHWWHRQGKREFGIGDIDNAEQAQEAYEYWVQNGKPTLK